MAEWKYEEYTESFIYLTKFCILSVITDDGNGDVARILKEDFIINHVLYSY